MRNQAILKYLDMSGKEGFIEGLMTVDKICRDRLASKPSCGFYGKNAGEIAMQWIRDEIKGLVAKRHTRDS